MILCSGSSSTCWQCLSTNRKTFAWKQRETENCEYGTCFLLWCIICFSFTLCQDYFVSLKEELFTLRYIILCCILAYLLNLHVSAVYINWFGAYLCSVPIIVFAHLMFRFLICICHCLCLWPRGNAHIIECWFMSIDYCYYYHQFLPR